MLLCDTYATSELHVDNPNKALLSDVDTNTIDRQAALLGMNVDDLASLQALAHRMSMTSISTAYSGIDSPGTAILQIVGRLTKHYGLQVNHPHHLFAVEWERSCQHELCVHPGSADCIFGDIADFLHPLVRSQLPELQKNNQLTSVLMPVVRDTPTKAILMIFGFDQSDFRL